MTRNAVKAQVVGLLFLLTLWSLDSRPCILTLSAPVSYIVLMCRKSGLAVCAFVIHRLQPVDMCFIGKGVSASGALVFVL